MKGHEGGDRVTYSLTTAFWPMWMHQLLCFFELEEEEEEEIKSTGSKD